MVKKLFMLSLVVLTAFLMSCSTKSDTQTQTVTDANGYTYEYVEGDPAKARIYTLKNGLKIYLSVNKNEPRVQTLIAVRAGAKEDPRETTGLAHYFEHMMFKGSTNFGTSNWEAEAPLIKQISDLFELRCQTTDEVERAKLYAQIDSLSQIASQYAVANEYDKISSMIGATGTNAWTSYDETVYVNEIPSNEIDRWAKTESDRFENLVLRLFHTELETVFEEFNMSQDNDSRRIFSKTMETLFPTHPYGISVLGKGEHLKNPSMENIMQFKADYYVPNNIAICMSGDLNFEETVATIDKYWGHLEANENMPKPTYAPETPITEVQEIEIFGPERESVMLTYRTPGKHTKEEMYLSLIGSVLYNGQAGLIDLDLVKKQKVMSAYAYGSTFNDYGMFVLAGTPREGQTLEEVKDLLLAELDKVKKGEFDEWLLEAIMNEAKMYEIESIEANQIAYQFVDAFISNTKWEYIVNEEEAYRKITKDELVTFANEFFNNNHYVSVYKRMGENKDAMHIEKPQITPLTINRTLESTFAAELKEAAPQDIKPVFVDFKEKIKTQELAANLPMSYIKNEATEMFDLNYIFEMGKFNNKMLPLAVNYLQYLGTKDKTIEDLEKEWYRLGVSFGVYAADERCYVSISGLDQNMDAAVVLMENIMANVQPNQEVYNEYVNGILKGSTNAKLNKNSILWGGLFNYSKYGAKSPFTDILSEEELKSVDPKMLTDIISDLLNYQHEIFYFGPREASQVAELLKANHNVSGNYKPVPAAVEFPELDYTEPEILFVNYDMVQAMISVVSKDTKFDASLVPITAMFNEYYGGSMSSIVFQEIREAKGLAYSCFAGYNEAGKKDRANYVFGFLSTQPDKMKEALDALTGLLNDLALSEESFANSKDAIIKKINTERIIKSSIYWTYRSLQQQGIDYDIRKDVYDNVQNYELSDVEAFFNQHIAGKKYDLLIVGSKDKIDFNLLKNYGKVNELTLEEVFNY